MAVTLDATVGGPNSNTFITVATANSLANQYLNTTPWTGATTDDKGRALIRATAELNPLPWVGTVATTTQALAWPRTGATINGRAIAENEIPREVQQATFEVALALLQEAASPSTATGSLIPGIPNSDLRRAKIDVLELEWRTDGLPSNRAGSYSALLSRVPSLASTLAGAVTSLGTGGSGLLVPLVRS